MVIIVELIKLSVFVMKALEVYIVIIVKTAHEPIQHVQKLLVLQYIILKSYIISFREENMMNMDIQL